MANDWKAIRDQFPALSRGTYLNTATFGQLANRTRAAIDRHLDHRDETACADFLDWFNDADQVRASVAQLLHAQPEDIAFISMAGQAISLLIAGIDWQPGDRIVTLENEFPNQIYFPALLAEKGVELVVSPWEHFYESITPRTRLVALSGLSYLNGFQAPAEEVGRYCRERNVLFYLDATQGCGALEFDLSQIPVDVFAVHAYKWMLAPNGTGFMYVAPQVRQWLKPNLVGWRSDRNWRNVDQLEAAAPQFGHAAERYEGGMLAHSLIYGLGASVEMMLEIGPRAIEQRVMELAGRTRQMLEAHGGEFLEGEHYRSPILAPRFPGHDASLLAQQLKQAGVLVSARYGRLRVSTHFYNNENDIDRLSEVLKKLLA